MFEAAAFYLFAAILIASAMMVIIARNPVHSVLFLIFSFFNAAGLFVLLGAEFVAFILVIVYVGAVAVLFLFVVMMLDISFADLRREAMRYIPAGLLAGGVLLTELFLIFKTWSLPVKEAAPESTEGAVALSNTQALGSVLYTDYIFAFQVAGLILLVAMIGAIVLTFRRRPGLRRQKISDQVSRKVSEAMQVQKITPGTGV